MNVATTAGRLRSGDEILVDPLNLNSGTVIADLERSQHLPSTRLWMIVDGEICTAQLPNDQPVRLVR